MRPSRGFSLLEVLVAVALFALAMGLAYGGLDAVVRGRAQLQEEAARLAELQRVVGLLERDLRAAVPRGVRLGDLRQLPALLIDPDGIELTRSGHANRLAQPRAELERVRWTLQEGGLARTRFVALDRGGSERPREDAVLQGVSALDVEALTLDGRWVNRWPLPGAREDDWPRAVRIGFEVDGLGRIERVLELAEAVQP
ncbi:type II secretion system minor pseudopilin GspJ [Pseudomarimonas salicorniae]|uniref:Type II secretion system protein J n=1 Tax=Pseudomarimonas salicorniae TaxID=2933270 RepID=A0ABT0GE02_9GAMM|nr:type II secretion system minor pseudopilin GspJ [Lysobacter sp. CAU 1642]MCK7592780.1 type II secretion system minor pseudopilin GspJ [Lysobacter sp. CAU 1642]